MVLNIAGDPVAAGQIVGQFVHGPTALAERLGLSVEKRLRVLILPAVLRQTVPGGDPTPTGRLQH